MKDSHYRISLDIHSTQSQVSLPVKQGDMSRKVFISLCEGGKPYHIEDDCFAVFSAKKPDGKEISNNCVIVDNVIEYTFTEQTTAASGVVDCEIRLYGVDSGLITSPRFIVIVDSRVVSDTNIESDSEYSALDALVSEANTAIVYANSKAELANSAASKANTATSNANTQANIANAAATNANDAADNANAKANLANSAATNANTAASDARTAAESADEMAQLASFEASQANKAASDATAAAANANETASGIRNSVSNALKGSASGNPISLYDVSPVEHEMRVRLSDPSATLTRCGKNLLDLTSLIGKSVTTNGGTLSCGADGGISGSGTASGYVGFAAFRLYLPKGKYILSASGTFSNFGCYLTFRDKNNVNLGDGVANRPGGDFVFNTENYPSYSYVDVTIKRNNDTALSGTAYFQIELGSGKATEYEPRIEPIPYTPNEDGTVEGVTSLYPVTTLMTDTEGVTITAEYNKDINKAFDKLKEEIKAELQALILEV